MDTVPHAVFAKATTGVEWPAVPKWIGPGPRRSGKTIPLNGEPEPAPKESPGDAAFHLCFRVLGKVRRLTPPEELALARRIQRGDPDAREQMIRTNLRRVVKIARDYEWLGLPLLYLVGEGNLGLIKGVERFEPSQGVRFSTHASRWIKQSIEQAVANQPKTVRLPVQVGRRRSYFPRAESKTLRNH